MQIGDSAFCMGSGLDNGAVVVLQNLDPARDVIDVISARLQGHTKVGGKECCAKLGSQFFAGVSLIAPFLAAKAAVKAALVARPMHSFMTPGRVIALRVMESRKGRKLNAVG